MTRLFLRTRVALAIGLAAATIALPVHAAPRAVEVDRIVAVVNSEVITALQLRARIEQAKRQLTRQGVELPPDNVLERQLLERRARDEGLFRPDRSRQPAGLPMVEGPLAPNPHARFVSLEPLAASPLATTVPSQVLCEECVREEAAQRRGGT